MIIIGPEEKNSEAEEHRRLNRWRDWHSSKTFGQPGGLGYMKGLDNQLVWYVYIYVFNLSVMSGICF